MPSVAVDLSSSSAVAAGRAVVDADDKASVVAVSLRCCQRWLGSDAAALPACSLVQPSHITTTALMNSAFSANRNIQPYQ